MWTYNKRLEYPINIKCKDPRLAKVIISQYGGPDGELAASLRYLSQRFGMPDEKAKAILNDIGTEELAPLGYSLSKQIIKVEINENGVFADGVSLEENEGIYSLEYYNTLLPIIQTGKEYTNQILFGIAIVSSIIALVGIIILKKKNK